MKKIKLLLTSFLMVLLTLSLVSFINPSKPKTKSAFLHSNSLVIETNDRKISLNFDDANFYSLVEIDEETSGVKEYGYRIIFDGEARAFIERNVGETKLLQGITDENELFSTKLSDDEYSLLSKKCQENRLFIKKQEWWSLYNIRDEYYSSLNAAPTITRSSVVSDYTLQTMTSTDMYINNYEPKKYEHPDAKKYEDEIVNIVPKEWFFEVGYHKYFGEEYLIFANTVYIGPPNYDFLFTYYKTDVTIFDVDLTDVRTSKVERLDSYYGQIKTPNIGYNFMIDVAIRGVYFGINPKSSSQFSEVYNIDTSKDKIVVDGKAFDFAGNDNEIADPVYVDISDCMSAIYNYDENINPMGLNIDSLYYEIKDKTHLNANVLEDYNDAIVGILAKATMDIAIEAISSTVPYVGPVYKWMVYAAEIKAAFVKEYNRQNVVNDEPYNYYTNYSNFNFKDKSKEENEEAVPVEEELSDPPQFIMLTLPNYVQSFINTSTYDYMIKLGVRLDVDSYDELSNPEKRKISYLFGANLEFYDYSGNKLLDSTYSYYQEKDAYLLYRYALEEWQRGIMEIDATDALGVTVYSPIHTGTHMLKVPSDVVLEIKDMYGNVISSTAQPYGTSQYLVAYLEEGELYYCSAYYLYQNQTGEFSLQVFEITDSISSSASFVNNQNAMSMIYKYTTVGYSEILAISTESDQDPDIAVYTDKGQYVGGDDDYYYDDSSDDSDYNAYCEISMQSSHTYYIIINTRTRNAANKTVRVELSRK